MRTPDFAVSFRKGIVFVLKIPDKFGNQIQFTFYILNKDESVTLSGSFFIHIYFVRLFKVLK